MEEISLYILLHIGKQTQVMSHCAEQLIVQAALLKCEGREGMAQLGRGVARPDLSPPLTQAAHVIIFLL